MQKTILNSVTISGNGLHTGQPTSVRFLPAKENTGIRFQRIDLEGKPLISATIQNIHKTKRRTVLKENNATIETVEHVLATLFALSITNILIEVDGPEIPILDGSSKLIMAKIEQAGIKQQNTKRKTVKLNNYFKVQDGDSEIEFFPQNTLEIEVNINYNSNVLKPQKASLKSLKDFKLEIAPARTFCFLHEVSQLVNLNLIKGGSIDNAIVFVENETPVNELGEFKKILQSNTKIIPQGILNDKKMLYQNEQAKHKLLDLIGDMALAEYEIKGKIVATKPGHKINILFTQKLLSQILKNMTHINKPPIMKIDEIKKILPHREPFLFIDEIMELTKNHVTGIKYVQADEYYFKGHFPGSPVMPGVLQIEAMAQTGGILALNSVPDPENYLTYFMKIDKVKFKQKVEPNCILMFKLNLLSPIRRGICHMEAKAYVDNQVVTEAELMAKIVKEKDG